MKHRILILSTLVVASALSLGLRSPPKDQCRLSLKPVFQSEDEKVWRLTIETREPARYRIVSECVGGGGGFGGNTGTAKQKRGSSEDGIWLVFSQITPSGNGPTYLKTILMAEDGSCSVTRETRLGEVVESRLLGKPSVHPLNTPVVLADSNGQRVRLMVGENADQLQVEPVLSQQRQ